MSDYLAGIAQRALGVAPVARPVLRSVFAQGVAPLRSDVKGDPTDTESDAKDHDAVVMGSARLQGWEPKAPPPRAPLSPESPAKTEPSTHRMAPPSVAAEGKTFDAMPLARNSPVRNDTKTGPSERARATQTVAPPRSELEPGGNVAPSVLAPLVSEEAQASAQDLTSVTAKRCDCEVTRSTRQECSDSVAKNLPVVETPVTRARASSAPPQTGIRRESALRDQIGWQVPKTAEPSARASRASEPVVRVTVGRIEVRLAPSPVSSRPPDRPRPALSLSEYLKQRSRGAGQ